MFGRRRSPSEPTSESQDNSPAVATAASDYVVVEPSEEKAMIDGVGNVRSHDYRRKDGNMTPKSGMSGATNGTTDSRLCHYLEDSLQKISQAAEQLESAGTEYNVEELDNMFNKEVLPDLQRAVLRCGNMEEIQLDILVAELQGLLDAADRCLDSSTKTALQTPLSKLARMLARLKTSHDQAVTAKKALGPGAGSLALSHPQDFDDFDSEKAKSFTKQMQSALVAQQQQAELIEKRMQAMFQESLRQQQALYTKSHAPAHGYTTVYPHVNADGTTTMLPPQATPAPITIHNHLAANQAAEAASSSNHFAQHLAHFAQNAVQKLKHAAGGPMGFVFAGVAGLVARDLVGRYITRGTGKLQRNQSRALQTLRKERKIIAREAQRQLHACERAYHETKNHAMKPIRMPFDKPSVECSPNYHAFEEHDD